MLFTNHGLKKLKASFSNEEVFDDFLDLHNIPVISELKKKANCIITDENKPNQNKYDLLALFVVQVCQSLVPISFFKSPHLYKDNDKNIVWSEGIAILPDEFIQDLKNHLILNAVISNDISKKMYEDKTLCNDIKKCLALTNKKSLRDQKFHEKKIDKYREEISNSSNKNDSKSNEIGYEAIDLPRKNDKHKDIFQKVKTQDVSSIFSPFTIFSTIFENFHNKILHNRKNYKFTEEYIKNDYNLKYLPKWYLRYSEYFEYVIEDEDENHINFLKLDEQRKWLNKWIFEKKYNLLLANEIEDCIASLDEKLDLHDSLKKKLRNLLSVTCILPNIVGRIGYVRIFGKTLWDSDVYGISNAPLDQETMVLNSAKSFLNDILHLAYFSIPIMEMLFSLIVDGPIKLGDEYLKYKISLLLDRNDKKYDLEPTLISIKEVNHIIASFNDDEPLCNLSDSIIATRHYADMTEEETIDDYLSIIEDHEKRFKYS